MNNHAVVYIAFVSMVSVKIFAISMVSRTPALLNKIINSSTFYLKNQMLLSIYFIVLKITYQNKNAKNNEFVIYFYLYSKSHAKTILT